MLLEMVNAYLQPAALLAGAYALGYVVTLITLRLLRRTAARRSSVAAQSVGRHLRRPARFLFPLVFTWFALPLAGLGNAFGEMVTRALVTLICLGSAWLVIQFTSVVGDVIQHHYETEETDNLKERRILTQMQYIKRIVGVIAVTIALSLILMQFPRVRELGTGLLASAGVLGIIIGIAAQRPISNLLAGFQIAFTQPIRIDDVVIVEGEWGRVEEITLTYVVIRIWDQRRLVVPLLYFLEKPFQNWTRTSAELLGVVYLYVDYRLPVEPLRKELNRLLEHSDLWDRRVATLQVTNSTEQAMEIRAVASAANSSNTWDLRCLIREELITFIQQNYPEALPRTRLELPQGVGNG